jgi:hypothetical protein
MMCSAYRFRTMTASSIALMAGGYVAMSVVAPGMATAGEDASASESGWLTEVSRAAAPLENPAPKAKAAYAAPQYVGANADEEQASKGNDAGKGSVVAS